MNKEIQLTREHSRMLTNKPTYKATNHLNCIVKLFKDKIPAKQIAGMYPEYFSEKDSNKIYTVKAKLIQLGLAEKCPIALKMVATKKRLLEESSNVNPITKSVNTVSPENLVNAAKISSTIKIKFHGVMLEIEKSSHIIITREQVIVQ
jgi:hypothetical protein